MPDPSIRQPIDMQRKVGTDIVTDWLDLPEGDVVAVVRRYANVE